jgi:hypothetical protein
MHGSNSKILLVHDFVHARFAKKVSLPNIFYFSLINTHAQPSTKNSPKFLAT